MEMDLGVISPCTLSHGTGIVWVALFASCDLPLLLASRVHCMRDEKAEV